MGQMSATIDGNDWTAVSFNNTIVKAEEDGVEVKRIDIGGTAEDGATLFPPSP